MKASSVRAGHTVRINKTVITVTNVQPTLDGQVILFVGNEPGAYHRLNQNLQVQRVING